MQVSIRKEGNHYAAFFYEAGELHCYTRSEGYAPATVKYMRTRTKAADGPGADDFFHRFCGLFAFDGPTIDRVKRLSRP